MEQPQPKSADELRAEELRRVAEQASKELKEARDALEREEGRAKEEKEIAKKNWGPLPQSPYMALNVLPNATKEEVQEAYKKAVKEYFPDQPGLSAEQKKEAEEWMKIVNEAREALLNPNFKPAYFKEYAAKLKIEENMGKREEETRVIRRPDDRIATQPPILPKTRPQPPTAPTTINIPPQPRQQPPQQPTQPAPAPITQGSLWNRWKRRILIGLGIAVAGGVGTEVGKKVISGGKESKEPVPIVSPAYSHQAPQPAIVNNFNPNFSPVMNQINMSEAVAEKLRQARMEEEAQRQMERIKAQMAELKAAADKNAEELARAQAAANKAKEEAAKATPAPAPVKRVRRTEKSNTRVESSSVQPAPTFGPATDVGERQGGRKGGYTTHSEIPQ